MKTNYNKSLFWYGFFANFKKGLGKFLIICGIISLLINWILGVVLIVFGIILISKGYSQRFDYKRKSGYIVHSGDN